MHQSVTAFAVLLFTCVPQLHAREWVDVSGRYRFKGEFIAGNETMVVLEKSNKDKDLVSIDIDQLSDDDQQYLREQAEKTQSNPDLRTWTTHRGIQVRAALVEYVRRQVTIRRHRGKAYVNDKQFDNLPGIYRRIVPQVVSHFEKVDSDEKSFKKWVKELGGKRKTFTCEGVLMELENGDHYAVPFFLLSEEDLAFLKPGYEEWTEAKDDQEARDHYSMSMRARAINNRKAQAQVRAQAQRQEVMKMHFMLQGVEAGVTDLWEVTLLPPNNMGMPRRVVVPGRDSRQATALALSKFRGYRAGPARKVSY